MSNKFTEIIIKNCAYCFINDLITINNLHPNKIKIDKNQYKNTNWILDSQKIRYIKMNVVNLSYLIINKINEYIEKSDGNKYLMLVPIDESKYL